MAGHAPSIISYLGSIDWHSHEDRLLLVIGLLTIFAMVSVFFEPSLGLAAICMILWVELTVELESKVRGKWPRRVYQIASKFWFLSGVMFSVVVILDTGFNPTQVVPIAPTNLSTYFSAAVAALVIAVFLSYYLLDYVARGKEPFAFGVMDTMLGGVMILLDGSYLVTLVSFTPTTLGTLIGGVFAASLVLAILASVVLVLTARLWHRNRTIPLFLLTLSPVVVLLLYVLSFYLSAVL